MRRTLIASIIATLWLTACAPSFTLRQQAFLKELASRPVTCESGADCGRKWNRAIEWVSKHSKAGIAGIGDHLIAANMMSDGSKPPNRYPEFTVVRYASGGGQYKMDFDSYCEHGFACNPTAVQLRADFVTFIMGLPPGVAEVRPGVFEKTLPR